MTDLRFDGDVVIVTGAGRGLGRAHALAFAACGAAVVVNDPGREPDGTMVADGVVAEITSAGGRAIASTASVADPHEARQIVQTALDHFGDLTVLINNAGIISYAPFADITQDDWRRMMAVTLDGTFFVTQAAWTHFVARNHGRIINTTSNVGILGNPTLVHYGAAKLGVAGLTRALALEAEGTGITVNAIAPMAVTRMNKEAFFGDAEPDEIAWQDDIRRGKVPIGPAHIVSPAALWLAHRSTQVNGAILSTSSGRVARVTPVMARGYFNPDHGADDLAANQDRIMDLADFEDFANAGAEIAYVRRLFDERRTPGSDQPPMSAGGIAATSSAMSK